MNKLMPIILVLILSASCTTRLSYKERAQASQYKEKGIYLKKKSVAGAIALGFLPGGGSFYTGAPGIGVVNLLLWPTSILWDPISGYNGAQKINYQATKSLIEGLSTSGGFDKRINKACINEFSILNKEINILDKETFFHNCAIEKRKAIIDLGL